jgi:hypothetical protein
MSADSKRLPELCDSQGCVEDDTKCNPGARFGTPDDLSPICICLCHAYDYYTYHKRPEQLTLFQEAPK